MNLLSRGLGVRFAAADLQTLDPVYFSSVITYAAMPQDALAEGRGLLLSGPPGVGKTWALCALMKHLLATVPRFDFQVVTAPELFAGLYDRVAAYDHFRDRPWSQVYETVPGLVINDLGKEDRSRDWIYDAVCYKLGRLLRARNERMLPIFVTTNLPLQGADTLTSVYGESIWSLLYEMTTARLQIVGPDRRRGGQG